MFLARTGNACGFGNRGSILSDMLVETEGLRGISAKQVVIIDDPTLCKKALHLYARVLGAQGAKPRVNVFKVIATTAGLESVTDPVTNPTVSQCCLVA